MDSRVLSNARHKRANRFSAIGLFSGLTSFSELERRIAALDTRQERGDAFEVFAEAYLATQKINQAEEVWPDGVVPGNIVKSLKLPPKDMGVDGVYRTLGGGYAAYQVKFRTGRASQTWSELSKFIGLADRADLKVLFTNSDEVLDVVSDRRDFFCIRGADLDRLSEDDWAAIDKWLQGAATPAKPKTPFPHQAEAITAITNGLETHDRVTSVMACGTGKTLTSLWLAERLDSKRILVLVPSLALIRQTLHEWLKETRWVRPRFLAVCSDPTVRQKAEDQIVVNQADLDFPVSTDPEKVRAFLSETPEGVQVVFSTYQSAHVVGEAMDCLAPFDLGIFDEAHKTAGREGGRFAFALEDANLPIAKRVFLTATPRHYDVRSKDKEGDKKLIYSMDVPETYGPIVHSLSFAEAAERGIICHYKVIISVVTSEMINDDLLKHGEVLIDGDSMKARSVANQIALQQACEELKLRKVFSFHRHVASARDFTGDTPSAIKTHMPDYETLHVNGAMRTAARENVMGEFRSAERAIISNARCLTEGVDVPAVDVVAFLSPRKSKVDIVQAAGRAMRKADGKEFGYLLLPLFLETEAGETVEEALDRTGFQEAWDVLQAMQEQDAKLADVIQEMRVERGRTGGFDDSRLREKVEVLGPEVSLEALRRSVAISIVDRLGATWDERLGQLRAYRAAYGDCNVPRNWSENRELGIWVNSIRQRYKKSLLNRRRIEQLEKLGFIWDPHEKSWEDSIDRLKKYKNKYGNCNVPQRYHLDPALAKWVNKQRAKLRNESLERNRIEHLNRLGFVWNIRENQWEKMFQQLEKFRELNGHCNVPYKIKILHRWVTRQRQDYAAGNLSQEKLSRLKSIDFAWNSREALWEERYAELKEYEARYGNCEVPVEWKENRELGLWVANQRRLNKRRKLRSDRARKLEELGFRF